MKKSSLILAAALLATSATSKATIDSIATFQLTVYIQESYEVDGNKETGVVGRTRLTVRTVLNMLQTELSTEFPPGARLVLEVGGGSRVTDRRGDFLYNTSAYVSNFIDTECSLFDGCYFNDTDQERSRIYLPVTVNFNFPSQGFNLSVSGLGTEIFNATRPSPFNGRQVFRGNIRTPSYGMGAWSSSKILSSGNVILNGRLVVDRSEALDD